MAEQLQSKYDENADVLYLSVGAPNRRARSKEDPYGLIWRTGPDGDCQGVTIRNLHRWMERRDELLKLIVANMHVARNVAEDRIPAFA